MAHTHTHTDRQTGLEINTCQVPNTGRLSVRRRLSAILVGKCLYQSSHVIKHYPESLYCILINKHPASVVCLCRSLTDTHTHTHTHTNTHIHKHTGLHSHVDILYRHTYRHTHRRTHTFSVIVWNLRRLSSAVQRFSFLSKASITTHSHRKRKKGRWIIRFRLFIYIQYSE